jgi:hypothetical protein
MTYVTPRSIHSKGEFHFQQAAATYRTRTTLFENGPVWSGFS